MAEGTELPGSTQGALETTSTFHGEFTSPEQPYLASRGTGGEAPVEDSRSQSGCLEVPPTLSLGHVLDCPSCTWLSTPKLLQALFHQQSKPFPWGELTLLK